MKWNNKNREKFHQAVGRNVNIELKLKLLNIVRKKLEQFPNNPRGFRECEAYFKSYKVAIWGFYKGYKKYSKRTWKPIVDVPETFSENANPSAVCVADDSVERYYFPKNLAEKVLILGCFP